MSLVALAGALLAVIGLGMFAIGVFQQAAVLLRTAERSEPSSFANRPRLPRGVALRIVLGLALMVSGFVLYAFGR